MQNIGYRRTNIAISILMINYDLCYVSETRVLRRVMLAEFLT